MKVLAVYRVNSEYARNIEDFFRDFSRQTGKVIEAVDPDTLDGIDFCRTYDVVEYPSLIALSDDSKLLTMWRGIPLPTINEVSYYA